jgi:ABC-2 type transport system permease protein
MSAIGRSVFWALVRKDIYLQRGFVGAGLIGALISLVLMAFGKVGFAVGGILYLTANIASFIFITMYSFMAERTEKSRLFALSLPISGEQYDLAKLIAAFASYGIPWTILTVVVVGLVPFGPGVEQGMLVYASVVQGCFLALFSVLVASLFVIRSEVLVGLPIIGINIIFSLFMVTLSQPAVSGPITGKHIVWTPTALVFLGFEAALVVASLGFVAFKISRTRDHL